LEAEFERLAVDHSAGPAESRYSDSASVSRTMKMENSPLIIAGIAAAGGLDTAGLNELI
jgi:hypothetical protein